MWFFCSNGWKGKKLKKKEVVKKKEEFNSIIKTCPYKKNKYFTIYIKKRENKIPCFGLAISKHVGNAVVRNKLKRRLRMILDQNKDIFSNSCDYIIIIKKECVKETFAILEKNIVELIKEKK